MNFDALKDFFGNYFVGNQTTGIIRLIVDILLVTGIIIALLILIKQRVNPLRLAIVIACCVLLFFLSILFGLDILKKFISNIFSWFIGFLVIIYSQDIRAIFESKQGKDKGNKIFASKKEKEEIISVICNTVEYLSKRRIGALITFERKDSLESLITKAIPINADITQEILTTIFTPGTACHDGGVIIQNNKIVCAGAYYPLSDNYDIPKFLGTRHRAAIGISERYDALTVVVSEETGNISITVGGNINLELTIERVAILLDGYLSSK